MFNQTQKGILLALIGVLLISPDALFIKMIEGGPERIIFWKSFFTFWMIFIAVALIERKNFFRMYIRQGIPGLALGLLFAVGSFSFHTAIKYTVAANVLVTLSISPVLTAVLSAIILKETVGYSTIVVMLCCILGITVFFFDSLGGQEFKGNLFALATAVVLSIEMVVIRKYNQLSLFPCTIYGAVILTVIYWPYMGPYSGDSDLGLLFINSITVCLAFYFLFNSSRYIPATWTNMIMLLEAVFGTYLVWLFLDEQISSNSFIGGMMVLIPLLIYFSHRFKSPNV